MKRLALILGAVLLLGSTAHAGTKLPLNIVGSWCDPVDIKGVSYYRERDNNCKVDEGGDWMVVASNGTFDGLMLPVGLPTLLLLVRNRSRPSNMAMQIILPSTW
jgi:hypothetical protein